MKYHTDNQIYEIFKLQNHVHKLQEEIKAALAEADSLAIELYETHGRNFICKGVPYKMEHQGIGFGICGNRWWLKQDESIRIVRHGE